MNQSEKGELFYALHHRGHTFVLPNPWDIGSAKVLAAKGFEAVATTSVGVDHAMGKKAMTAGRDDMVANTRLLVQAVDLPVSVDMEDCYAEDASGVAETINLVAEAGAVGGSIEDAIYTNRGELYPIDVAAERVRAASVAASALPFKFTLCARCENFLYGNPDLNDTITRLNAYAEAGADVLYAPGLTSTEEVEAIVQSVDKPVNVLMGDANTRMTMADMHRIGVARVSLGSALHRVAMTAMIGALDEILQSGTFTFTTGLKSMGDMDAYMD